MSDPRALLDAYAASVTYIGGPIPTEHNPEQLAPKAFDALRAVLELHKPWSAQHLDAGCGECNGPGGWPCPTVQAITKALGGGGQ